MSKGSSFKRQSMKYSDLSPTEATISSSPKHRDMFTSISPNAVNKSRSPGVKDLEYRYRKLQENYIEILEKTREKNTLYQKQKKQLERYKVIHEIDKKQIGRLRGMLGFLSKADKEVQTNIEEFQEDKKVKGENTSSQFYNFEKSSEYESTKHSSWSKLRASKISQPSSPPQDKTPQISILRKLSNSPYSKYRFVAGINRK